MINQPKAQQKTTQINKRPTKLSLKQLQWDIGLLKGEHGCTVEQVQNMDEYALPNAKRNQRNTYIGIAVAIIIGLIGWFL